MTLAPSLIPCTASCILSTDCLLVQTGSAHVEDHGTLEVIVNGQIVSSGDKNKLYKYDEVVVDKCFASLDKIEVRNPSDDGWVGSISVSYGGRSYIRLSDCPTCVSGRNSGMSGIGIDRNSDILPFAKMSCINGATCELLLPAGSTILRKFC